MKSSSPLKTGSSLGSCKLSKYLCFKASSAVILFAGLISNILSNNSNARGFSYEMKLDTEFLGFSGKEIMYFFALRLVTNFKSSSAGFPVDYQKNIIQILIKNFIFFLLLYLLLSFLT